MTGTAALELENVEYGYSDDWTMQRIKILKGISLTVAAGEAFGFLGHNGAGKTTTIKCILGLVKFQSGKIKIFGTSNTRDESRSQIGYLPEQPYFYDYLSVSETLRLYGTLAGIPRKILKDRVDQQLELLKLKDRYKARMRTLSKGLTQRVGLAQALINNPRLLILDEPFSGLDPIGRREFREIILSRKEAGVTVFMSSHVLSDVEAICERASIMVHGEIKTVCNLNQPSVDGAFSFELVVAKEALNLKELSDKAFKIEAGISQAVMHFSSRDSAQAALRLCIDRGIAIESFERSQGSLEELFIKLASGSTQL